MKWLIGAICGLFNGLLGAGGGAVAVVALERGLKIPDRRAHATAIGIMLPLSVISAIIYLMRGEDIPIWPLVWITAGGAFGGLIGARILGKISIPWLNRIFGGIMLVAAFRMVF
ncbi:MAG: TSUP family transporter [Defluviitaleaceae bacterium]|nr:TSUP family transporter [Defluviitaleaceae bacterium]